MPLILFYITAISYGLCSLLYWLHLTQDRRRTLASSLLLLRVGLLAHLGLMIVESSSGEMSALWSMQEVLNFLAFGSVLAVALLSYIRRLHVLGAFVVPIALMLFLFSSLGRSFAPVSEELRTLMILLHAVTNSLGLIAFAIAFAASLAYIVQERLLRERQVTGIFQRLPALEELDRLGHVAMSIGFPLLTFGMITGVFWAFEHGERVVDIRISQLMGVAAWLIFATVLVLRTSAGWRGRKAAFGTIVGFVCMVGVLCGYVVRASSGRL